MRSEPRRRATSMFQATPAFRMFISSSNSTPGCLSRVNPTSRLPPVGRAQLGRGPWPPASHYCDSIKMPGLFS
jgi:hypothetical protein